MSWWQSRGHARTSASHPQGYGICDCCGWQYNLSDLTYQFIYAGPTLINTHFRVCPTCLDVPNENVRTIMLPPDPVPLNDPRPGSDSIGEATPPMTWIAQNAPVGATTVYVQSVAGFANGNPILIQTDFPAWVDATITSINPIANTISFTPGLLYNASPNGTVSVTQVIAQ